MYKLLTFKHNLRFYYMFFDCLESRWTLRRLLSTGARCTGPRPSPRTSSGSSTGDSLRYKVINIVCIHIFQYYSTYLINPSGSKIYWSKDGLTMFWSYLLLQQSFTRQKATNLTEPLHLRHSVITIWYATISYSLKGIREAALRLLRRGRG